jgi:hypothetical protein
MLRKCIRGTTYSGKRKTRPLSTGFYQISYCLKPNAQRPSYCAEFNPGAGAFFGVLRYPVTFLLSAVSTTTSYSILSRPV